MKTRPLAVHAIAIALAFSFGASRAAARPDVADEHGPVPATSIHVDYDAKRSYVGGSIAMTLRVDATGAVEPGSVRIDRSATSAPDELVEPTLAAARAWRFIPAAHGGRAVRSEVSYRIAYDEGVTAPRTVDATYRLVDADASAKFAVGRRSIGEPTMSADARRESSSTMRRPLVVTGNTPLVYRAN